MAFIHGGGAMKFRLFIIAIWSALLSPNFAAAQNYGNAIYYAVQDAAAKQCLVTKPSAANLTWADTATPVKAAMARYWAAAGKADGVAIAELFQKNGKAVWIANGSAVPARSGFITDPYARAPGNMLVEQPVALFPARGGDTARGLWEIRDQSGARVGHYLVDFRESLDWRPQRLELIPADAPVPAVGPYCFMPGDMEAAMAMSDGQIAKRAKKATFVASCIAGQDCAEKWARARQWVTENSAHPLIRYTDSLLLTSASAKASLAASYVVTLDPPGSDNRRAIRFRAWCGNYFVCFPRLGNAREAFTIALATPTEDTAQPDM